ncbi:bifunctional oligoribonuclease and PAP phosphatase NrnA [bacterium BMS3Abin04]|nr:bifunctional oligoribonuclease and PAP phosphatase NrnA [bacterium BMS3Abin04]
MTDFEKIKELIHNNSTFFITTHVNPDADAIGSEMALFELLKTLNKKVDIVNHNATPYNLEFLDPSHLIQKYYPEIHDKIILDSEVLIFLDLNYLNRTVKMEKAFRKTTGIKICLDHHTEPENFMDYQFINTDYSSTGEIIFDLIKNFKGLKLTYEMALPIYAAIMTDTGSFKYERTTPELHRKAAELLECGVNPTYVNDQIYGQYYFSHIKLLGFALESLSLNKTEEIAYMTVTRADLNKTGAIEADVDGFVNYCLSVKGIKMGILFFELKDGVKISFRSKGNIAVNKLAAKFNGGGHINASGCRLFNVELHKIMDEVLREADKFIHKTNDK